LLDLLYLSSHVLAACSSAPLLYALSLHDALPILTSGHCVATILATFNPCQASLAPSLCRHWSLLSLGPGLIPTGWPRRAALCAGDRKSTRLNSSHEWISYAVFCLKNKIKRSTSYS